MLYRSELSDLPSHTLTDNAVILDVDENLLHTFEDPEVLSELGIYSNPKNYDLRKRIYHFDIPDVMSNRGEGIMSESVGITRP